ncbi:hypothetical protein ACNOYE_13780 [Nannocystaceae bacterium ST9]
MHHARSSLLLVLALSSSSLGCDRDSSAASEATPSSDTAGTPNANPGEASHGPAIYFQRSSGGLVALHHGKFEELLGPPGLLLDDRTLRDPKRPGIYASRINYIIRYDGTTFDYGAATETKVSQPISLPGEGKLFASGYTSVGIHDGQAWQTWDVAAAIGESGSVSDAAIAPDGTIYASLPKHLAIRSPAGEWSKRELPIATTYGGKLEVGADGKLLISLQSPSLTGPAGLFVFDGAAPDQGFVKVGKVQVHDPVVLDGVVHVLDIHGKQVQRLVGGVLEPVHAGGDLQQLRVGADGKLYVLDVDDRQVLRLDAGKVTAMPAKPKSLPYTLSRTQDNYDVDAAGRAWLRTRYGVYVLEGEQVTELLPGPGASLPSLIERVVVSGGGPSELPELVSAPRVTMTGKVIKAGAPVAGVPIEVCALYVSKTSAYGDWTFRGKTPCSTSDDKFGSFTTDAEGRFTVENMARLGAFSFAYRDGTQWKQFLEDAGLMSCYDTKPGETCDIGTIKLAD